jgi:hypothetical protein
MADKNSLASMKPMSDDFSLAQPETVPDDADEKRKKSISRTRRWKEFRVFQEQRRLMYTKQTPGGVFYNQMPKDDAAWYAGIGNAVIDEIDIWMNFIEEGDI